MASGDTLAKFFPQQAEQPSSNYGSYATRNAHGLIEFDDTTQQAVMFKDILSRNYSGGGVTVYVHWGAKTAITGTGGWVVDFERVSNNQQDIDSDGFGATSTVTAVTVPGTSGFITINSVAVTNGTNMDSIAVGEGYRLRIRRDVANDNAVGNLQLWGVEIKET